jgi:ATP-dependent Lon protease
VRELPPKGSFRRAAVTLLEDLYPTAGVDRRTKLRRELLRQFKEFLPESALRQQQIQHLFADQIPLGVLTDIVAFSLQLELSSKQQLLTEWNVDQRIARLLKLLRNLRGDGSSPQPSGMFPPDFSEN